MKSRSLPHPARPLGSSSWLQDGGLIGAEIAARDWTGTALGPIEDWPPTLRTTLNLVLNSGLSMFVGWGEDFLCFYNDAYAPVLEGKSGALGRPLAEVFPEAIEHVVPWFEKALRGQATYLEELRVPIMRAGKVREEWWTASYSPIRDQSGAICGVFVPVHEITDRVEAEARLRASNENLRIVSNIVPGLLWRSGPDGRKIWINKRMEDSLGHAEWWDIVHPEDRRSMELEWERARREGTTFHHYQRLKLPDGSYRWHVATSEPRLGASGEIEEWCGIATDVQELRDTATALAESSLRFRSFADNSADAIWIADVASRRLEYVSPAFHAIWGPTPKGRELDWDYWLSTVHPDDRPQQEQTMERLLQGEVLHEQYRMVRPDGAVRWIRDTMFPILDAEGAIHKIGGIAEDITRQNGQIVHLIDGSESCRNALTQRLQAIGYQVRPFAAVDPFLRLSRALLPGCVIVLDPEDGAAAERIASALKGQLQRLPLVLVCAVQEPARAIRLMKQGVSDIVLPDDPPERLEQAVAAALVGMQAGFRENDAVQRAKERIQQLTDREREILEGLSAGATNKMLARDLGLSPRTVETYRVRLLERLGVSTLPEAAKLVALAEL